MSAFEGAVDGWIRAVLLEDEVSSFDALVCRLPGVYPTDVQAGVDRLRRRGELDAATVFRLRRRVLQEARVSVPSLLPVPHPLDYDWRFNGDSVDRLVGECELGHRGQTVVLLGAPSVFLAVREREGFSALLLDANRSVIEECGHSSNGRHRALLCDLRHDRIPPVQSSLVVADPPWYPEHERVFLWAAAQFCRPGGRVLFTLPSEGTRPGVRAERDSTLQLAGQLGFEVEDQEEGALAYVSPPFERNALTAVGLPWLPPEWRRCDLAILRLSKRTAVDRPECPLDQRWPEVAVGPVRIRVRPAGSEMEDNGIDPRLGRIAPGDILDSVSRRDPRRADISVWTSGNRVFGTESPTVVLEVIRGVVAGEDIERRVTRVAGRRLTRLEQRHIRDAVDQVAAVVTAERAELVAIGWPS